MRCAHFNEQLSRRRYRRDIDGLDPRNKDFLRDRNRAAPRQLPFDIAVTLYSILYLDLLYEWSLRLLQNSTCPFDIGDSNRVYFECG